MKLDPLSRQHLKKPSWSDRIQTSCLLIVAIIGFFIALASLYTPAFDFLITTLPFLKLVNLTALLLLVFSTLSIAVSLERYETLVKAREVLFHRHEEAMQKIDALMEEMVEVEQTLLTPIAVKHLIGHEAVYYEAERLIKSCKGSEIIRSTCVGLDENPNMKGYRNYLEVLAIAVGQGKRNRLGMVHKVVMGFRLNEKGEPPILDQPSVLNRRKLFQANSALDRLEIKCLENFLALNLLIVGNHHVIIGFPTIGGDRGTRFGIRITNTIIVESVIRWYDEYLWPRAKWVNWPDKEISAA